MADVTDRILIKNDVGRRIHCNTGMDLATDAYVAGDLNFRFQRPDATVIDSTSGAQIDDAATGQVSFTTATNNLNQTGIFILQVTASGAGKPTKRSDPMSFYVEDSL